MAKRLSKIEAKKLNEIFKDGKLTVKTKGTNIRSVECTLPESKATELKTLAKSVELCDNVVTLEQNDFEFIFPMGLPTEFKIIK